MNAASGAETLALVTELARTAGAELLRLYRASAADLEVDYKGPRDLVTRADHAAEEIILNGLQDAFAGDSFLSEESGGGARDPHPSSRLDAATVAGPGGDRVWIIDPLDGTTNYTHGHPLFAVSVALWQRGEAQLGVIHAPALGETYWALRGGGAFRDGERISVTPETRLDRSLLATGFSYSRAELGEGALELFRELLVSSRDVRRGGSACLDLAHTASGIFAGFWEYYLAPHDVAAGSLMVEEAGGVVTDIQGGSDYLHGRSIVAGAPAICEQLLRAAALGPKHPGAADAISPDAGGSSS